MSTPNTREEAFKEFRRSRASPAAHTFSDAVTGEMLNREKSIMARSFYMGCEYGNLEAERRYKALVEAAYREGLHSPMAVYGWDYSNAKKALDELLKEKE